MHIDALGIYKLGKNVKDSIEIFEKIIKKDFIEKNSTVLIPSFTYSYCKNQIFDMLNSQGKVGLVNEAVRSKNKTGRTSDPIFSHVCLGKNINDNFYSVGDIECFGSNSLYNYMFDNNCFISFLAAPFNTMTEIHYIEKILDVNYRFDKTFIGNTIDVKGNVHKTKVKYFCRDLTLNRSTDLSSLEEDLKKEKLIKSYYFKGLNLKGVFFKDLFEFVEKKIKNDYYYLTRKK